VWNWLCSGYCPGKRIKADKKLHGARLNLFLIFPGTAESEFASAIGARSLTSRYQNSTAGTKEKRTSMQTMFPIFHKFATHLIQLSFK
jgi:hypothetical protein